MTSRALEVPGAMPFHGLAAAAVPAVTTRRTRRDRFTAQWYACADASARFSNDSRDLAIGRGGLWPRLPRGGELRSVPPRGLGGVAALGARAEPRGSVG